MLPFKYIILILANYHQYQSTCRVYEQIFVIFLILGKKTFVQSRCAKVSTHEDIITVEMYVQQGKTMNNHNFTHGQHRKNEHFWPFGGPGWGLQ